MLKNPRSFENDTLSITGIKKEGETVRELVRRHLTDESHTTTDEELKNVKLSLYAFEEFEKNLSI